MAIPSETRLCPDCNGSLERIRILTDSHWIGRSLHQDIAYASPAAESSFLHPRIDCAGTIYGMMCGQCRRVFFYADGRLPSEPKEEEEPIPQEDLW